MVPGETTTGIDTQIPRGTPIGESQDGAPQHGEAAGQNITIRDQLIANQESLLNTYRCLLNVDTDAVPGGCANGTPSGGPTQPGVFEGTPAQNDVATRDDLIAAQESLLNVCRCQFGVDLPTVRGGCTNGLPCQRFSRPAAFEGTPTLDDIEVRDKLIAAQESLLNTHRCRFDFEIDTHIAPEGCPGQAGPTGSVSPRPFTYDTLVLPEDPQGDPPPGLITPTGVPVAVLGINQGRHVVMTPYGNTSTVSTGLPLRGARVV